MLGQILTYLPAMVVARLAGFAVLIGAAHLLDPLSTGLLALVLLTSEFSEGIFLNWLRIFVLRQGSAERRLSRQAARLCVRFWLAGIFAAATMAGLVGATMVGTSGFIGVALASAVSISLFKCGLTLLQMAGRARLHAALEGARGVIMAAAALTAMSAGGGWVLVAAIVAAVTGAVGLAALWLGQETIGGTDERPVLPDMMAMAPPLIGLAALNLAIGAIDRLALGIFASPAAVAPYATSYALGRQGFDVATNAVNAGGFPALVAARGTSARFGEQARLLMGLMLAGYAGLVLMRHELAAMLLPESYRAEAVTLLPVIGLGAMALNLKSGLTDNLLLIAGQYWRQMIGLGAGAAVATSMALFLVPAWGSFGAALAFALASITVLAVSVWQAWPLMQMAVGWTALVRVLSPAALVATACVGTLLLLPDAASGIRLGVAIALGAPLALFALQGWRIDKPVRHGG